MSDSKRVPQGPERLRVYDLALGLADLVESVIGNYVTSRSLAAQLRRAVESVVLNIAEGAAHKSPGRKIYHYQIAHGSAAECIAALTMVQRRNPAPMVHQARAKANMVSVMLTALIHGVPPGNASP